jgi:hypothetical protein
MFLSRDFLESSSLSYGHTNRQLVFDRVHPALDYSTTPSSKSTDFLCVDDTTKEIHVI